MGPRLETQVILSSSEPLTDSMGTWGEGTEKENDMEVIALGLALPLLWHERF